MNLSHRDGDLKEVFDDLEDAFTKIGVDFYLIGHWQETLGMPNRIKTFAQQKMPTLPFLSEAKKSFRN